MWFKTLEISSFGKWNKKVLSLDHGMNFFHGPNEAGKSTIRVFLTYILFGLKSDERERYKSKIDGNLGGRVVIIDQNTEWIIERFSHQNNGRRKGYRNGEPVSEERLNQLLKGMDRGLFESIFSFQDRDLHVIRHHKPEDIGKVLFNLGLTGSDQILEIENKLTKQAEDLFKKQGKNPTLNVKLSELKQLNKEIDDAKEKEQMHLKLNQTADQLQQELIRLKNDHKEKTNELKHLETILQVKSSILKYQLNKREMASLSHVRKLPPAANQIYDEIREKRSVIHEKINLLESSINKLKQELETLKEQQKFNQWDVDLTDAQKLIEHTKETEREIAQLSEEKSRLHYEIQKIVSDLNLKLSLKEFSNLQISSYTQEKWNRLSNQKDHLNQKRKSLSYKKDKLFEELQLENRDKEQFQKQMLSDHEYQTLSNRLEEIKLLDQKQTLAKQLKNQYEHQQHSIKKLSDFFGMAKALGPIVMVGMIVGYLMLFFESQFLDYGLLIFMLLSAIGLFLFFNKQHTQLKQSEVQEQLPKQHITNYTDELRHLQNQLNDYHKLKEQFAEHKNQINVLEAHLTEIDNDDEFLSNEINELDEDIEREISVFPFLRHFELYHWHKVYDQLQTAKQCAKSILHIEEKLSALQYKLSQFEGQINHILKLYDFTVHDLKAQFVEVIEKEKNITNEILQKESWLKDKEREKEDQLIILKPYQQKLDQLLDQAEVQTEEELHGLLLEADEFKEKEQQVDDAYSVVFECFGEETDEIIQKIYNWPELEKQIALENEGLVKCEERIEDIRTELSETQAQIKQLEENGILSDLIHRRALLESEIMDLAKSWAVAKTAFGIIKDTKNRYQNVYLPVIMKQTEAYFSQLTENQYVSLNFSNEEESILAKNVQGHWFDVKQLSEGTADQLYVSLRLALNDFLKQMIQVPFILDDAFVHFDTARRKLMLEQISRIAEEQQVIYLTCDQNDERLFSPKQIQLNVS